MRLIFLIAMITGLGNPASSDEALGIWQTGPDKKGQIAHVEVTRCNAALCGRIIRAYDSGGREIITPNVGKQVFWDMTPEGPELYRGRAWVPAHDREYAAKMVLEDDRLKVSGCVGPICQSQVWARLN